MITAIITIILGTIVLGIIAWAFRAIWPVWLLIVLTSIGMIMMVFATTPAHAQSRVEKMHVDRLIEIMRLPKWDKSDHAHAFCAYHNAHIAHAIENQKKFLSMFETYEGFYEFVSRNRKVVPLTEDVIGQLWCEFDV